MIPFLRSVAAVLLGYVLFAVCSFATFRLLGHAPHAPASLRFMAATTVAGVVFAIAGGYLAGWIAGRRPVVHAVVMAAVLAVGAAASLVATLGNGAIWSQVAALILMTPAAVYGGWLRAHG
jgi:hypothetical protein